MIARPNIIKDTGRLLFWYPLRWLVLLLPFGALHGLGKLLGWGDIWISSSRRQRMMANLRRGLGPQTEAARILLENLANHARNNLELLKYPQLSSSNIDRYISFDGIERVDSVLREGRGVLLATGHFGAKQALQVGLGHKGYKAGQINYHMERLALTWVQTHVSQRLRMEIERSIPVTFVSVGSFLRAAYQGLKRGEVLVVASDGSGIRNLVNDGYRPFEFLGHEMLFPMGMVALAKRTGASIVPAFAVRERHRHRLVFEPALNMDVADDDAIVKQYVAVLERYVRKYPELWEFWEEFDEENLLAQTAETSRAGDK